MSFKLNDYNAFLTSLYEKKSNIKSEQQSSSEFPVDFDFGLPMSMEDTPDRFNNINTEFIAETGASGLLNGTYTQGLCGLQLQESKPILQTGLEYTSPNDQVQENLINQQMHKPGPAKSHSSSQFGPPNAGTENKKFDASLAEAQTRPRTKSAHNVIEQRYRNKINDKFTVLQNTVPSLRVAKRKLRGLASPDFKQDYEDDPVDDYSGSEDEDLEGLEPAKKLNKGTILTKSIEYIKFLEMKNNSMLNENEQLLLKARLLGILVDESFRY